MCRPLRMDPRQIKGWRDLEWGVVMLRWEVGGECREEQGVWTQRGMGQEVC